MLRPFWPAADVADVRLEPITAQRFATWAEHSARGFADQQVRSGMMTRADAGVYAERQLAALLPQGPRTPGHHIWTVQRAGSEIGVLWIRVAEGPHGVEAYVFDIEIDARLRGHGLGRATMLAAEEAARERGAVTIGLNVFGHNTTAMALYDRLGYRTERTALRTQLADPASDGDGPVLVTLEVSPLSGNEELWTGRTPGSEVGALAVRRVGASDGRHTEGRDLVLLQPDLADAFLAAVERRCRAREDRSLTLTVTDGASRRLLTAAGYTVTAQQMRKALAPR